MMKFAFVLATLSVLEAATTEPPKITSGELLYKDWKPYSTPLVIPDVIDMRQGGSLEMNIGETTHTWQNGVPASRVYGYGKVGGNLTTPGPTILVNKSVPIQVTWNNVLGMSTHLLSNYIDSSLLHSESACFPNCGIPVSTHIHGLETPPKYDGLPHYSIYKNQSYTAIYNNSQSSSTKLYHDHAIGLSRLNMWAGLTGMYIIQDPELEKKFNFDKITVDVPLMISDKLFDPSGKLMYTSVVTCPVPGSVWMPESFGSVNTVNGVVQPYLEVPPQQVRFRLVNLANARNYNFTLPFADKCTLIATDAGFVQEPKPLNSTGFKLYSLERVELICDFSSFTNGTKFDIEDISSDADSSYDYDNKIMQIHVVAAKNPSSSITIPTSLNKLKDLQELYKSTNGKLRTITLGEMESMDQCPTTLMITQYQQVSNVSMVHNKLFCTRGKVEKWQFKNPTDDVHPFHWHLVKAQCGPDDKSINKNELKDVVVIPNADLSDQLAITQVCYVACTPDEFLLEGSSRAATDFGFSTDEPYLAHCHIMEHEDNSMMAWFQLTDVDDSHAIDDGTVANPNEITGMVIGTAIGMSILGGFATTLSVLVLSIPRLNFLAGDKALAMTFALSAGVMLFIALVDLFLESIEKFKGAYAVGGNVDLEAIEHGLAPAGSVAPTCDKTCAGLAWLSTVGCFYGGVLIVIFIEFVVHRVFDYHAKDLANIGHTHEAQAVLEDAQSPVDATFQKHNHEIHNNAEVEQDEKRNDYRRAGALTGIAIAIHNFPEGLALFVASLQGLKTGIVLAIGIILHNFPEGIAIAAPVYYATNSKKQAFLWTGLSGIAQPCGAFIGWATISGGVTPLLSGILYSMVSGMLVCIAVKELLPGAFKFGGANFTFSFLGGFFIMAVSLICLQFVGTS
ncbi:Zinc (Zn2)-Iron (Fe2) Permease (ZIP) Family [Thraustotheca clavata]|uniref:Zinc (Zn2)-Iron (Fe2) Permease (ZIP) Family n=1 Tax=Thraustotheca clavata TaxID=74557 RepID=A0A1W0A8C8_9STRA|nr:Zinc (Zn2)-Iron (Fe2) Permease (ZIP) Family [Thraustotheca clavata]